MQYPSKVLSLLEIMENYNVWQLVAAVTLIHNLEVLLEKNCTQSGLRDHFIREPFISRMVKPPLSTVEPNAK